MSLWIFQSIVNLLLINAALFWLLSRKQTKFLQAQVDRLEHDLEALKSRSKNSTESQISSDVSSSNAKISSAANNALSVNHASAASSASSANISSSINIASSANSSLSSSSASSANISSSINNASSGNVSSVANVVSPANMISPAQEFAGAKEQKPAVEQMHTKNVSAPAASNLGYSHPMRSTQSASAVSISSGASSLVEKQSAPSGMKNNSKEAFEKASMMLSSGVNVKEISRVTGLSLAELQLMNKFATRVQ